MTTKIKPRIDTTRGDLILVNARHPLGYIPHPELDLIAPEIPFERRAARMLAACLASCGAEEEIVAVSGYRTRAEQNEIFADSMRENGEAYTRKFVALPGCSEHETGLAIDLAGRGGADDFICPSLPHDGAGGRFRAAAADYGFVERYPKNKTHITGIGYEPWHFRYVGWPHAGIMVEMGLVLEEYLAMLAVYPTLDAALCIQPAGRKVRIFTTPEPAAHEQYLRDRGLLWQASGNNSGGVVFTVWG